MGWTSSATEINISNKIVNSVNSGTYFVLNGRNWWEDTLQKLVSSPWIKKNTEEHTTAKHQN